MMKESRIIQVAMLGALLAAGAVIDGCGPAHDSVTSDPLWAPERELVEIFRLGGEDPSEPEVFGRAPLLLVDHADRLYLLERQAGVVAVFGPDGSFLRWIRGGKGEGPGEFTSPKRMGMVGDTLWIRNQSPPRLSLFEPGGSHIATVNVQLARPYPTMVGLQGISGYLKGGRAWVEPDGFPPALIEELSPQAVLELGGRTPETAGGDTVVKWRSNRGRLRGLSFDPIPEPPFFSVASDGSAIAVVDWTDQTPGTLTVRLMAPNGRSLWRTELAIHSDPLPTAERDSIVAEARTAVRELRESLLSLGLPSSGVPEVPTATETEALLYLPSHRPPVRGVRVGTDGSIWLEVRKTTEGATWLAMDGNSGLLFTVTLPSSAIFGQATRQSVWYSEVDDLGIPWVVRASVSGGALVGGGS